MGVFWKLLTSLSNDKDLIKSIQEWDNDKFSILYERYYKKIYQYTLWMLNFNIEETEEIITEIFLQIFNYIKKGNEINNPNAIFYRIAHNVIWHFIQDNQKISSLNLEDIETKIDEDYDIKEIVDNNYKQDLLNYALMSLNDEEFIVMYSFYILDKTYADIDKEFKIDIKKIWTIVFYSKKKLKDFIFNKNNILIDWNIKKEVDIKYQLLKEKYSNPLS